MYCFGFRLEGIYVGPEVYLDVIIEVCKPVNLEGCMGARGVCDLWSNAVYG